MTGPRVAVIGLRHGARHVWGFLAAGAEVVYAVDLNKELHKEFNDERVIFSQDYQSILPKVDFIVISLPPFLHEEALRAALKTGAKRIWIEKPLLDIGEDVSGLIDSGGRVEVVHELRRCKVIREWRKMKTKPLEMWLTWQRPVPPGYDANRHPVGVLHDLGSHLIDLSFALTEWTKLPTIDNATIAASSNGVQDARYTMRFGGTPVHIQSAWVEMSKWPENEITIRLQTPTGETKWASQKSTHRHLTAQGTSTTKQIEEEKNWYISAVQGELTFFSSLDTASMVQKTCNDIVSTLERQKI